MKRLAVLLSFLVLPLLLQAGTANLPGAKVLYLAAGTPSNGTNEIQTLTFAASSSGTFTLRFNSRTTNSITWSATNNTLRDNIDTALEALGNIGTGGVTTAVGTMTAGIGTITVTFTGTNAKNNVAQMTVPTNLSTGSVAVSTTTAGVTADGRNSLNGTLLIAAESGTGNIYYNSGNPPNPNWEFIATANP